jgi:hypothetical protein
MRLETAERLGDGSEAPTYRWRVFTDSREQGMYVFFRLGFGQHNRRASTWSTGPIGSATMIRCLLTSAGDLHALVPTSENRNHFDHFAVEVPKIRGGDFGIRHVARFEGEDSIAPGLHADDSGKVTVVHARRVPGGPTTRPKGASAWIELPATRPTTQPATKPATQ